MFYTTLFGLLYISLVLNVLAAPPAPSPTSPPPFQTQVELIRRNQRKRSMTDDEFMAWATNYRSGLKAKYGVSRTQSALSKRFTATTEGLPIINMATDTDYIAPIAVGTPPQYYYVILDTGSADLWLAKEGCNGCGNVTTFNPNSSTLQQTQSKFVIGYGDGNATGTLVKDNVQLGPYEASAQTFGLCDQIAPNLLHDPVSGIMGLGWDTLATSGAIPLWQNLAMSGAWVKPVMTFQLTRYLNQSNTTDLEPGGTFTMGSLNESLYTGNIEWHPINEDKRNYWSTALKSITVGELRIIIPPNKDHDWAAIDTGTTLIGGPADAIAMFYKNVPGATNTSGLAEGFYTFPCANAARANVSLNFGGRDWPINPVDFAYHQLSNGSCVGALFDIDLDKGEGPIWIIGDTFLKSVYSVFQYTPSSLGFAQLSETATNMSTAGGTAPSPTHTLPLAVVAGMAGNSSTADSSAAPVINLSINAIAVCFLSAVVVGYVSAAAVGI